MLLYLDTTDYQCYEAYAEVVFQLVKAAQELAAFVDAHTEESEEGVNCTATSTDINNMMSQILRRMGAASLAYPFDRAVYPLPSGDALEVLL